MSHKSIAALLMLIAAALGGPVAVQHVIDIEDQVEGSVAISGPETAQVGQLVHLTITGSRPSWLVPTSDAHIQDNDCYISFRVNGTYEVVGTSIAGGETSIVKQTIVVGPPRDAPKPDDLDPLPPIVDLARDVADWCEASNAPKATCKQLGYNFIKAATDATTVPELLDIVSRLNRDVNQTDCEDVLAKVQRHLFDKVQGRDFSTHQCAFSEIGDGLEAYASSK